MDFGLWRRAAGEMASTSDRSQPAFRERLPKCRESKDMQEQGEEQALWKKTRRSHAEVRTDHGIVSSK